VTACTCCVGTSCPASCALPVVPTCN
jgi:hypothetical protein